MTFYLVSTSTGRESAEALHANKEKTCVTSYMNKENIQANACGVVHTERQHRPYIHYTNNTYMYLQKMRGGERKKERKKERKRKREGERACERVSV